MLKFSSARNETVNSRNAMRDALEQSLESLDGRCDLVMLYATMGHNFEELLDEAKKQCPDAEVIGCSAAGVVGKEGGSEKMRTLAIMAVQGSEFAFAWRPTIHGVDSFEVAAEVAAELKEKNPNVNMVNILASGIDIAGDKAIAGIESVFGTEIPIFGGTSGDNMKAKVSMQFADGNVMERGIVLVGFSDPSLELVTGVHHGSKPIGKPYEVTRSEANRVYELDGEPAWPALMARLGLPVDVEIWKTLAVTGMGQELPEELQAAYHNKHHIHSIFKVDENRMSFYFPSAIPVGTKLWLMERDEELIFGGLSSMVERFCEELGEREPIAMFHTDCGARGRLMFNKILKDEIILRMQGPICGDKDTPWLGLYGFGEFTPLAGKNRFHTQTSSLYALVRK